MKDRNQAETRPAPAAGRALEAAAALWAIGLMGYYYYSKGYLKLMGQIWRLFFG